MHLFGFLGTIMFLIGFFSAAYLGISKLLAVYHNVPARLITDRPSFYIALTAMIMGTFLFMAGFLGELISRNSPDRNRYLVDQRIQP